MIVNQKGGLNNMDEKREPKYYLRIHSSKTNQLILEAQGISEVCAYNLIKLYGNYPTLVREDLKEVSGWDPIGKK